MWVLLTKPKFQGFTGHISNEGHKYVKISVYVEKSHKPEEEEERELPVTIFRALCPEAHTELFYRKTVDPVWRSSKRCEGESAAVGV